MQIQASARKPSQRSVLNCGKLLPLSVRLKHFVNSVLFAFLQLAGSRWQHIRQAAKTTRGKGFAEQAGCSCQGQPHVAHFELSYIVSTTPFLEKQLPTAAHLEATEVLCCSKTIPKYLLMLIQVYIAETSSHCIKAGHADEKVNTSICSCSVNAA